MINAKILKAEAAAAALINAGEAIKAKVKEATDLLNRAYSSVLDIHNAQVIRESAEANPRNDEEGWKAYAAAIAARDLPFDLHHVRADKHRAAAESTGCWNQIEALVNLRAEVKAIPIVVREAKGPTAEEQIKARVLKSFSEIAADRRAAFDWAKAIIAAAEEVRPGFRRLQLHVHHVYCQNQHGTEWIRIDWFLNGRRTAFNVIAAAWEAVDKAEEVDRNRHECAAPVLT
jgi:hypothetical protein